jgi:hypothetical protein
MKIKSITGTCYFPSIEHAYIHYHNIGINGTAEEVKSLVGNKINEGQIHIGKPVLKANQRVYIKENRYFIEETE